MIDCLIIGGGPAGLMAADVVSAAGHSVVVADAMPTVGRKFLMAGKSGLNLTKAAMPSAFLSQYGDVAVSLRDAIAAFGPDDVVRWSEDLGQPTFEGSTGRVFPKTMKASPLLRAWLQRLMAQDVTIRTRHRWTGWDAGVATFDAESGPAPIAARTTILAMGGASWRRLGSDGAWATKFPGDVAPFQPSNVGFAVDWSPHMAPHFGSAVKGVAVSAGPLRARGEFVISSRGLEGGGIYEVSKPAREGAALTLDFAPDLDASVVATRLAKLGPKVSASNALRKALKLDPAKRALIHEFGRSSEQPLAVKIKALRLPVLAPHPIDQAISTAGGLRFDALDASFMLRSHPGVFAAGEMLDWEAQTGGYLITACLATGRAAGLGALSYLQTS